MICKYCTNEMKEINMFDNNTIKAFSCSCKALYILDLEDNNELWHDGKPPRAHCIKSFNIFEEGMDYRVVNADKYQVLVRIEDKEFWIDKDDERFKLYM